MVIFLNNPNMLGIQDLQKLSYERVEYYEKFDA